MSEKDWRHVNRIAATNEVVGYYASSEFGKRSEQFRCKVSEADYRKAATRAKQIGRSNQARAQALFDLMHAACGAQRETDAPRHHATMKVKIPDSGYMIGLHGGDYVQAFRTGRGALADSDALKKATLAAEALAEKSRMAIDIVRVGARGQDRYLVEEVYPREWGQDSYRAGKSNHATKKSPAQLQREIDEALTRRGEEPSAQYAEGLDDAEVVELARGRGRGNSFRDLTEMADAIEATGDARSHATKKSPTKGGMHPHAKGQRIMYEVSMGGATKELHPTKAKAIARAKTLAGKRPTAVFRVVLLPGEVISYHRPGASTSAIWHSD